MRLPVRLKISTVGLIFCIVLLISAIVRIGHFDYPLAFGWGDGPRDYLVAHHIKEFGEIPLIGPFNPLYEHGIRNSPLYYHLLSLFLIPHDSILTLGFVNIGFQLLTIVLVYLLAKTMFGRTVGLISVVLFSFAPKILEQSQFIWQPYLMQPFTYAAFYFLLLGHLKKKHSLLLASISFLILAGVLHNQAYILLPQLLFMVLILLKKQRTSMKHYLGLAFTVLSSFLIFYLPVVLFTIQFPISFSLSSSSAINSNQYGQHLLFNISELLAMFFSAGFAKPFSLGFLLMVVTTACLISYVVFFKHKHQEKWYMLAILLATAQLVGAISIFPTGYQHYLTLVYGLLIMLLVEVLYVVLRTRLALRVAGVFVFIVLFITILSPLAILQGKPEDKKAVVAQATQALQNEVHASSSSFQVVSYVSYGGIIRFPRLDAVLLVPLEETLKKRLVRVDNSRDNFTQINGTEYLVLACYDFEYFGSAQKCMHTFLVEYPEYQVIKHIYTHYPFSLYLSKRI